MAFKGVRPEAILTRVLFLDLIHEFPPHLVHQVEPEAVVIYEGENGEDQFDINWGWLLFKATQHQLSTIVDAFQPTQEKAEKMVKESLILDSFGRNVKL